MTDTLTIRHRITGEVATVMDISDKTARDIDRIMAALVHQVDFGVWEAVDSRQLRELADECRGDCDAERETDLRMDNA